MIVSIESVTISYISVLELYLYYSGFCLPVIEDAYVRCCFGIVAEPPLQYNVLWI